ncbi:hypothetical protein FKM82_020755 [Ascaphus truei]
MQFFCSNTDYIDFKLVYGGMRCTLMGLFTVIVPIKRTREIYLAISPSVFIPGSYSFSDIVLESADSRHLIKNRSFLFLVFTAVIFKCFLVIGHLY